MSADLSIGNIEVDRAYVGGTLIYDSSGTSSDLTINGISYKTTKIGDQIWMAENLRDSSYEGVSYEGSYLYRYNYLESGLKFLFDGWRIPSIEDVNKLNSYLISVGKTFNSLRSSEFNNGENYEGFNAVNSGFVSASGNFKKDRWSIWTSSITGIYNYTPFIGSDSYDLEDYSNPSNGKTRMAVRLVKDA